MIPVARLPRRAHPPARRPQLLHCPACRRVELRPPDTVGRPAPGRWPECCGRPMVPAGPVPTAVPDPDADATPWADRRHGGRLLARAGVRIDIRAAESGPDVAIALLDVCLGGAKVALRGAVRRGDRLLVSLGPPDGSWGYRGRGVVRWYVPGAEGTGLAGVQLRRPLSAQAAADLSE